MTAKMNAKRNLIRAGRGLPRIGTIELPPMPGWMHNTAVELSSCRQAHRPLSSLPKKPAVRSAQIREQGGRGEGQRRGVQPGHTMCM
mmetsp:Transcript_12226/g.27136  ORF Transcript_12226/g.27136 Transcript_12226/m.27136 type:complete len:87 (+) Transcript_12226:1046-1306(+)